MCSWVQQTKELPQVAKVDLVWQLRLSPEVKVGQLAPTPGRCSAGCLKNRQCVLEECESDIQHHPVP
ncbi:hypothetical protein TNCV_41341 [Trichonephila clavipes]|nr:hypothetical protein TNCV_41341 [Trichonephila clavipes]